jgi:hypothetical protein
LAVPTFMDVHRMEGGVSATDVAKAHQADLATQEQYGVQYRRYWVDESPPTHREAHSLVPDEIYEVTEHSQQPRQINGSSAHY